MQKQLFLLLKPNSELLKKMKAKIWKLFFVKKISKSERNDLDPDPFFPVRIRIRIRIKIKWILSTAF